MEDMCEYLWETLYVLKALFDHGKAGSMIRMYENREIDGDDLYEMAMEGIGCVFADTRCYYNEEEELDVFVFFDPIITEFFRLCEVFEAKNGIPPENDSFRQEVYRTINYSFSFNSYSYSYHLYTEPARKNGCRIVLLLYCEFCAHYEAVEGLLDIYDTIVEQTVRLKEVLGMVGKAELTAFPIPESDAAAEKEAA